MFGIGPGFQPKEGLEMTDLLLQYRAAGQSAAMIICVRWRMTMTCRWLGEREDFGSLILICETRRCRGAAKCPTWEPIGSSEMFSDTPREKIFAT